MEMEFRQVVPELLSCSGRKKIDIDPVISGILLSCVRACHV